MLSEKVSYERFSLEDGRQIHDERGHELPDPTPLAPPVGYNPQPSLAETIRRMVRSEKLAMEAEAAGMETFEEADDFDVGDDYDPTSPYEEVFDPTPARELKKRKAEAEKKEKEEAEKKKEPLPPEQKKVPDVPPDQGGTPISSS